MDTFISTTKLIIILAMVILVADAQDVVCKKGKTRKKVIIGAGDTYSFKTQAGATYAPNTKCSVTYKRNKATCPMIKFTCSQFDIDNKDSSCKKKDKMTVLEVKRGRKERKSYCQSLGPDITTSEYAVSLKISFLSDKKKQASGAVCTVQCTTGPATTTTTTTTEEPDTTTTTAETSTTADTTTTAETTTTTGSGLLCYLFCVFF